MRGHSRAFSIMEQRLPALRDAGIPFGFIFTLTQFNLDELVWAADFALQQAASLLQVHPLEPVGRALDGLGHAVPDPTELSYAVLAVARLKELVGDRLVLQLDVAGRDSMADFPERVFADGERPDTERPLGELLSPLIVEADGTVVPVEYAFGRRWALGNARDNPPPGLGQPLEAQPPRRFSGTVWAGTTRCDIPGATGGHQLVWPFSRSLNWQAGTYSGGRVAVQIAAKSGSTISRAREPDRS